MQRKKLKIRQKQKDFLIESLIKADISFFIHIFIFSYHVDDLELSGDGGG